MFQITTEYNHPLATGRHTATGVELVWRADVGVIPPVSYPSVASALKAFRAIAPTASRIVEVVRASAVHRRVWTGGHHPKGNLRQRRHVPTPDEQLAIVDCVD